MVFEHLRVTPQTRIASSWGNAVVDALEQIYALAKRGDQDTPYEELYAKKGYFSEALYVQGKPVIKDGDPITVSDLGDDAKQKITNAIDSSNLLQSLLKEFEPASNKGSIKASENASGFEVVLDKGGRPFVNVYYNLSGAGRIYVKVSNDGTNWRTLDVIDLPGAGDGLKTYTGITFRYVKVQTDTTGIDVEFEISASR